MAESNNCVHGIKTAADQESAVSGKQTRHLVLCPLVMILSVFISICSAFSYTAADDRREPARAAEILRIELSGSINPGMLQFFRRAVKSAEADNAELLLIVLNTPGGLVRTLRDMIQTVMASEVPVAVYVSPAGAQAASAGALLTMSANIAAMAPGTNIGAAHPIIPGGDSGNGTTINQKMENDVAALARSIATERGRNIKWAEEAVRKSVSATASEALELGIIDMTPRTEDELLSSLNGMEVRTAQGIKKLHTAEYSVKKLSPGLRERVMSTIADPDIAYILMMIGAAGLYFELAHPGTILPGAAGAISLILGLFATQVLPVNTTGMLLLMLAMILFIMELFITSHGILAAGGFISLVIGSLLLYDTPGSGIALSASVMWPTVISVGGFFMAIALIAARAQFRRPRAGREALQGEHGTAREDVGPEGGMVFVHGELWKAVSDSPIPAGTEIEVTGVHGMKLSVRRTEPGPVPSL